MNLDARLRRALQPVEPPDDFARLVRTRVEQQRMSATPPATGRGGWRSWLATAAAVVGVVLGTYGYQQYEQRREAIAARAQVLLALQIASRELNTVQRVVVRTPDEPGTSVDGVPAGEER